MLKSTILKKEVKDGVIYCVRESDTIASEGHIIAANDEDIEYIR